MRKIIVLLAVMLAFVGAAAADSISGSGSYTWNGGSAIQGNGAANFASGMALDLYTGPTSGTPIAASTVGNTMTVNVNQMQSNLNAPIAAMQYGSNAIALNNQQEPGTTDPQIMDFQATSSSGGALQVTSEGIGALTGTPVTPVGATFTATSVGYETSTGNFLQKNVVLEDTNTVTGNAQPTDAVYPTVPNDPLSGQTLLTSHLKSATFSWGCTDGGDVKLEDAYTKDQLVSSGIVSSATATGEADPTWNGVNGATAGLTTNTLGVQNIQITLTPRTI